MKIKLLMIFFLLPCCCNKIIGQHIKDSANYLAVQMKGSVGEIQSFENGDIRYTNRYTVTAVSISNCIIEATVKMENILPGRKPFYYTLTYSIPLEQIDSIRFIDRKIDSKYAGAALAFTTRFREFAIHYTMIEDLTGRIEADAGYSESTLWCNEKNSKQVFEILNDLRRKCSLKN